MLRPTVVLGLALAFAPALAAQEKPTAEMKAAISGTWHLDRANSDTLHYDEIALLLSGRAGGTNPRVPSVGGGGGGGGGRGGRGGGGSAAGGAGDPPANLGGGGDAGGGRGGRGRSGGLSDPKTVQVLLEARPVGITVISATDNLVTIADSAGTIVEWLPDGKKRQEAQFEGGVIESQAGWKFGDFFVLRGVPNGIYVRREYKLSKDAKSLEMHITVEKGKKVEQKFFYTKG